MWTVGDLREAAVIRRVVCVRLLRIHKVRKQLIEKETEKQ